MQRKMLATMLITALLLILQQSVYTHAQLTATLTASNTIVDSGQAETLTAGVSGGIAPYTVNFFNVTGNRQISSSIYAPWTAIANSYPTNVASQSCVTTSNNIYCIGGFTTQYGYDNRIYYAPILNSGDLGAWTAIANSYPTNDTSQSCVTASNTIYCIGGDTSQLGYNLDNSIYYAPILNSGDLGAWTAATNSYPTNVASQSCIITSNIIYCIGGLTSAGTDYDNSIYYAPNTQLGRPRHLDRRHKFLPYKCGFTKLRHHLQHYLLYRRTNQSTKGKPDNSIYYAPILDSGDLGAWTTATNSYPTNDDYQSCITTSKNIYCIGGSTTQYGRANSIYYAPILGAGGIGPWAASAPYSTNVDSQSCIASPNNIYCIGGSTNHFAVGPYGLYNSVYHVPILSSGVLATTIPTYTFTANSPATNIFQYNVIVTDSTSAIANSITNSITVTFPTVTLTPSIMDIKNNQTEILTANIIGGIGPFLVTIYNITSNTINNITSSFDDPTAISLNPSGTFAYVANFGGTVSVIDTASNTVVNTITVGSGPTDMAINPSGTLAYVVNRGDGTVSVIDTASNTVVNTITVGSYLWGIALNPSGTLAYVTNSGNYTVSVIDTASNTVVNTINVSSGSFFVAINPSGTLAYVTSGTNYDTVSVIDIVSNTVINTITVGSNPSHVAFNPSGTLAYVTNLDGTVSVIDTASNTVINTIVGSIAYTALNPSGTLAYVSNFGGSGTVSVIDTASNAVVNTIPVGGNPYFIAFNPSGTLAYVTNIDGTVSVIDTVSNTVNNVIISGAPNPSCVAFNPSGNLAYINDYGGSSVSIINTATNTNVGHINVGNYPISIAFNPSGTLAYVANLYDSTVSVIDVTSNTAINTITVGSYPVDVTFSPDGTLTYVVNSGNDTVSVIDVATNTVINTITVGFGPTAAEFNPSGTLAYVVNSCGNSNTCSYGTVSVIDTTSNTVINTINVSAGPDGISINPSGTLAYVVNRGDGTVSVIDTTSNTVINTINVSAGPDGISINPSGTLAYVVGSAAADGPISIIATASNTVIETISLPPESLSSITIDPLGRFAYVTSDYNGGTIYIVPIRPVSTTLSTGTSKLLIHRIHQFTNNTVLQCIIHR